MSLKKMLVDQAISIDGDGINSEDLMGTNLVETLDLVLYRCVDSTSIRFRFNEYIQPLIMEMSNTITSDELDEALATYCVEGVRKHGDSQVNGAKRALSFAIAIAEISKASLHRKHRLMKKKDTLINMVLNVTNEIALNLSTAEMVMDDKREIIESMWTLYETLPVRLNSQESKHGENLQELYLNLVGIDILSRWPGIDPFNFFKQHKYGEENSYLFEICKSYTSAITTMADPQDQVRLLQDLLGDVQSLNEVVFGNTVDLATVLCKYLIPTFLEKGYFLLVASYLGSDEKLVDRKQILCNVVETVDEAMFSESIDEYKIANAVKCQEALEPLLPEIQSLFQSNRKYLDASSFISTVLLDGKGVTPLKPSDLKEMHSLDVVETILQDFPECILFRCSQWTSTEYAQEANALLREAEFSMSMEGRETNELPTLPGGAVFHLATILGLENTLSAVVVKSRVICYALQGQLYGAAAAIARTLLNEREFRSSADSVMDEIILQAIADMVSAESYQDYSTKKELCETVLRGFDRKVSINSYESFNTILGVSSNLAYITSRFDQEIGDLSTERKECLLSRPIARLHVHAFHEYNRDIHCLFKDLSKQATEGLVHDSLMDSLSRFTFYWCIHDSITLKNFVDLRCKADTRENLKLGCGLVLQTPSILTAGNCVDELQEIMLTQAGRVSTEERFKASNISFPDQGVLRHLIDRGFSENAARRALTMTGNTGLNEAMHWAVSHTSDPDLNDPLLVLKPSKRKFIDESTIHILKKSLTKLSDLIENPSSRSFFLHDLTNGFQSDHKSASSLHTFDSNMKQKSTMMKMKNVQNVTTKRLDSQTRFVKSGSEKKDSIEENKLIRPSSAILEKPSTVKRFTQHKGRPLPPPPPPKPIKIDPKLSTDRQKSQTNRNNFVSTNGKTRTVIKEKTKKTTDKEEFKRRGKEALDKLKRDRSTPRTLNLGSKTKAQSENNVGREDLIGGMAKDNSSSNQRARLLGSRNSKYTINTAVDREELRKRGQAALDNLRLTQNKPENRRRLIEEGRHLLKQSQKNSPRHSLATTQTLPTSRSHELTPSALSTSSSSSFSNEIIPQANQETENTATSERMARIETDDEPSLTTSSTNEKAPKTEIEESKEDENSGWDFDDSSTNEKAPKTKIEESKEDKDSGWGFDDSSTNEKAPKTEIEKSKEDKDSGWDFDDFDNF